MHFVFKFNSRDGKLHLFLVKMLHLLLDTYTFVEFIEVKNKTNKRINPTFLVRNIWNKENLIDQLELTFQIRHGKYILILWITNWSTVDLYWKRRTVVQATIPLFISYIQYNKQLVFYNHLIRYGWQFPFFFVTRQGQPMECYVCVWNKRHKTTETCTSSGFVWVLIFE